MPRKSRPYEVGLHERLGNRAHAISYIKAAAADSIEGFLLALRDVADATLGMSKVAEASEKNRENLYRMLSEDGNPRLKNLDAVLGALGLHVSAEPIMNTDVGPLPADFGRDEPVTAINQPPPINSSPLNSIASPLSQQFTYYGTAVARGAGEWATSGLWSARDNLAIFPVVTAGNANQPNPSSSMIEAHP
jgi:probable addiction module antidote protein